MRDFTKSLHSLLRDRSEDLRTKLKAVDAQLDAAAVAMSNIRDEDDMNSVFYRGAASQQRVYNSTSRYNCESTMGKKERAIASFLIIPNCTFTVI